MRVCHNLSAGFDDPNLVSCAGLVPVMALAERAGLHDLVAAHVRVPGSAGSNPAVKVAALVAGMVAGADTIDAMDLLRHGGMGRVLTAGRAPSTLGTFLRSFTFGHVRQLDAVASRVLVNLAGRAPLLAGADQVTYLDIDDTIKATYGHKKQGAGYGYSKVKGLNALLAIVSTPVSAPVIAATRPRRGPTNSAKGAARLVADALVTAAKAGATGMITVRADSAYYNHDVIAAARTGGARFSVTARTDRAVSRAITQIPEDDWVGITYPHAIYDEDENRWISAAPPGPWPRSFTPRRPPPRSAPSSSPCPPGSRVRPAGCAYTYPSDGPGNTRGRRCSPPPAGHRSRRPDHPAPEAQPRTKVEDPDRPALVHARTQNHTQEAPSDTTRRPTGGSRFILPPRPGAGMLGHVSR